MIANARYLHLLPGAPLPDLGPQPPFLAFVLVRADVEPDWQWAVSKWLVASGCLSMAAWGIDCTSWDDSVDYANLEAFSYRDIPEDFAVMTSWHEKDSLEDAFFFARHVAFHPTRELEFALILDISAIDREAGALEMWARA